MPFLRHHLALTQSSLAQMMCISCQSGWKIWINAQNVSSIVFKGTINSQDGAQA